MVSNFQFIKSEISNSSFNAQRKFVPLWARLEREIKGTLFFLHLVNKTAY